MPTHGAASSISPTTHIYRHGCCPRHCTKTRATTLSAQDTAFPFARCTSFSRQGVARTYGGQQTPNIAGLGGKALTQVVSRYYYPPSATTFLVLASKFGYSVMRDVIFSSIREFYPDAAAHFIRKHKEKTAATAAALDASIH